MARPPYITDRALTDFINAALLEDIGEGDHSTLGAIPVSKSCTARLLVKDEGIIAGMEMAELIFAQYDPQLIVKRNNVDGDAVHRGDIAFTVEGNARSIISTERLVLNCMQRMSGIATYTKRLQQLIEGTKAQLTDTRKTTPNFRLMEKWAVFIGGGRNHRYALYDMVMLKDNHVDMAGGIATAVNNVRAYLTKADRKLAVEVETRTLDEVKQAADIGGVDVIMLDNMSTTDMKKAVDLIGGRCKIEASGGITEATIRDVALCGVDYISVGALTHSVRSLDLSLKVVR